MQIFAESFQVFAKVCQIIMLTFAPKFNQINANGMNIKQLLESNASVSVCVSLADLKEFVAEMVAEAEAARPVVEEEKYLTIKDVCGILGVTKGTLWRWDKSGYLKAIRIGRNPQYRMSDINHLREGKGA